MSNNGGFASLRRTTLPAVNANSVPDAFGGLIVTENQTCYNGQTDPMAIMDLDPVTLQPIWQITAQGYYDGNNNLVYCFLEAPQMAIRGDGNIFISAIGNTAGLPYEFNLVRGTNGQNITPTTLVVQPSTFTSPNGQVNSIYSVIGPPVVDSAGTGYVEYQVRNVAYPPRITFAGIYLLEMTIDYHVSTILLSSTTEDQSLLPGRIIPDGQGGVVATWTISPSNGGPPQYPYQAAHVVSGSVAATYNLPFSPTTLKYGTYPSLVLGENGTAFATDGADTNHGPQVISFNLSTGSVNWSYQATAQSALTMLAVTSDGGIAINNSQNGVLQLSPGGAASQLTASLGGIAQYSWSGNWFVQGSQDAASLTLPVDVDPGAIWATPKGNPSGQGASDALCSCLLQSSGTGSALREFPETSRQLDSIAATETPSEVANAQAAAALADCPICQLVSPNCLAPTVGSQSTYLIIVGDPGKNNGPGHMWNQGSLFGLAAQQQSNDLQSQGHRVIACRATTVQDFNNDLTTNGLIDGGVIYFGHAGRIPILGILYSAVFVGQDSVTNENLYAGNVASLSNAQIGPNAAITLNACYAGSGTPDGRPSIAQLISNQLRRGVYAYLGGTYFSSSNSSNDRTFGGAGEVVPSDLPVYLIPEGAPYNKPKYLPFTPN